MPFASAPDSRAAVWRGRHRDTQIAPQGLAVEVQLFERRTKGVLGDDQSRLASR
jgi:hypothetical protein